MAQLLLEFFSEEIPARMQARAERDLERLLIEGLAAAGLIAEGVKAFAGPRRLAVVADGLPVETKAAREERKGPRVGAPEKAVEGFLRGAGLKSLDEATVQKDPKGDFYVAVVEKPGRRTADVIAALVPEIVKGFPWPKSMRSADQDLYWVRPLQRILCAFDGEAVAIDLPGVPCGDETSGHRFHAPAAFRATSFEAYERKLFAAKVIVQREARKSQILAEAKTLAAARNLELVEDAGLLEEVAGLAEWPLVVMGDMDPAFLALPAEVIRLTMRTHQKYFAVRDPATAKLAPHFITVANIEAKDGGKVIAAGNARVLSARLNDARFFWAKDGETPLYTDERREKLKQIVFHQKLGSVWDKVERVKALAKELAPTVWASMALGAEKDAAYPEASFLVAAVEDAATHCKMDLVTETVGEFPELQGQIGRQLFVNLVGHRMAGIAAAIEDHYRPLGPNDRVPEEPAAITLALADKLDTLAGFWAIDEKPTGSSDAYGLRRAALGVVRIILERGLRLALRADALPKAAFAVGDRSADINDLLAFLADRLKVQLRDQGKRHDLVDAVFALGDDDLVRIVARVEALDAFLKTEDGKNLLAGNRRAANILAAEEKKGKGLSADDFAAGVRAEKLIEPAEKALATALAKAAPAAHQAAESEDFAAAMRALSTLRAPVDAFFEAVLVNADDPLLRRNRLLLLAQIRDALKAVADFSKIEG